MSIKTFFRDYKSVLHFCTVLTLCVVLSHWLSHYIPLDYFNEIITPTMNSIMLALCLSGAWAMFRHAEGMRIRLAWGITMLVWGCVSLFFLLMTYGFDSSALTIGRDQLTMGTLFASNILGWVMLLYPTEVLRPGWLTVRRAFLQLLPLFIITVLDYVIPYDLRFLSMLYPLGLLGLLILHVRVYKAWCEENYSTLDEVDVQWIWRYLYMMVLSGASLLYMCITDNPARAFTQQWLFVFIFVYSTDEIIHRPNPWKLLQKQKKKKLAPALDPAEAAEAEEEESESTLTFADEKDIESYKEQLDVWMASEKPYLSPEFRLLDLREVLPLNRTYLSQFISTAYGCNFYQYVARYRVEEAQRLMREKPEMKMQEVAEQCGFSSQATFAHVFTRETDMTPTEWQKKFVNS